MAEPSSHSASRAFHPLERTVRQAGSPFTWIRAGLSPPNAPLGIPTVADVPAGDLSGGEKARLLFALISHDAPHLLILDEPTNHLDIPAREALVQSLAEYEGAVVLVSHDTHLVELIADRDDFRDEAGIERFLRVELLSCDEPAQAAGP